MNGYFFGIASASVMSALLVTLCSVFGGEKTVRSVKFASAVVICLIFFTPLLKLPQSIGGYIDGFAFTFETDAYGSAELRDYGIDNLERAVEKMVCAKFDIGADEIEVIVFTEEKENSDVEVVFADVVLYSEGRLKNSGDIADYVAEILSCGVWIRGD